MITNKPCFASMSHYRTLAKYACANQTRVFDVAFFFTELWQFFEALVKTNASF